LKLRLKYNHENLNRPILSDVILKTAITINILEAKISPFIGELLVDVPATGDQLKRVISLFQEAKVSVKEVTRAVEIDRDRCVSCGACVSPCPVKAIRQDADWEIEFDEKKCTRCGICVDACPLQAIIFHEA
jgi:NAD-dependent dihydropyrimidine dehydrogenase PreA subunit